MNMPQWIINIRKTFFRLLCILPITLTLYCVFLAGVDLKALGEIIRCLVKVQRQNLYNSSLKYLGFCLFLHNRKVKLQLKCLQEGFPWRCLHLDTLFLWKLKVIPFERRVLFYKTYFWHLDWWVSELYQNHKPKLDILLQVHMIETVRTGLVSGLQLQCSTRPTVLHCQAPYTRL